MPEPVQRRCSHAAQTGAQKVVIAVIATRDSVQSTGMEAPRPRLAGELPSPKSSSTASPILFDVEE
jgi:hypothetical protein